MNDDYLRRHSIKVSDWAWKTAQELFEMKQPASKMGELLDWALRERQKAVSNLTASHQIKESEDSDPGTIITATRETICHVPECHRIIGVGEKMIYFQGKDGRKKSECYRHRLQNPDQQYT
jgi:hypothetical protein